MSASSHLYIYIYIYIYFALFIYIYICIFTYIRYRCLRLPRYLVWIRDLFTSSPPRLLGGFREGKCVAQY